MRVALVYDRLNKIGGAEQVLTNLAQLYPHADWYTSVWDPTRAPFSQNWRVHTSWLSRVPWLKNHHEWIPYLMPFVFEFFDLRRYDLVISVGSAESKGVITKPNTPHLHYCLTPTRYLYSHSQEYLRSPLHRFVARYLRRWDQVASTRPDEMIAISTQVKKRIKKYYNCDTKIIFPPINTKRFATHSQVRDYFLVVSRLVPYKKIDLLIKAANQVSAQLLVIGEGSEFARLKSLAGPTVTLLGHVPDSELPRYYANSLAYLQANEEDFGISMCEAQASGKPVIAYGAGGALDIVIPGKTGLLVGESIVEAFAQALLQFDTMTFVPSACADNARRFDQLIWQRQMQERISALCQTNQR